jgi:hypothetical protein
MTPTLTRALLSIVTGCAALSWSCSGDAPRAPGPGIAFEVAPLELQGITDACYALRVRRGAPPGSEVVWEKTSLCASRYGDGEGSLSYVGTCDASGDGASTVELVLEDLYHGGPKGAGSTPIGSGSWQNPCPGPTGCVKAATCVDNADTPVVFDLVVARAAEQGFFDVAVNFEDIFCSAKVDCNDPDTGKPLALLFNDAGVRDATLVFAMSCFSGSSTTVLHLSDVVLDCPSGTYAIDPTGGPGKLTLDATADQVLFGASVYEGVRPDAGLGQSFWSVALGIDEGALDANGCTLRLTASASDASWPAGLVPDIHTRYPVFEAAVPVGIVGGELECGQHPLDRDGSLLRTRYAAPGGSDQLCHELVPGAADLTHTLEGCTPCGGDADGDGVADCVDKCPDVADAPQSDVDGDGLGDLCDGCPATDPDEAWCHPESSAAEWVSAADGGLLMSYDGTATFVVPPGALVSDTTISFTRLIPELGSFASFEFQPSGLQFDPAATLATRFDCVAPDCVCESLVLRLTSDAGAITDAPTECAPVDAATCQCEASVSHFSKWEIVTPCNDDSGCKSYEQCTEGKCVARTCEHALGMCPSERLCPTDGLACDATYCCQSGIVFRAAEENPPSALKIFVRSGKVINDGQTEKWNPRREFNAFSSGSTDSAYRYSGKLLLPYGATLEVNGEGIDLECNGVRGVWATSMPNGERADSQSRVKETVVGYQLELDRRQQAICSVKSRPVPPLRIAIDTSRSFSESTLISVRSGPQAKKQPRCFWKVAADGLVLNQATRERQPFG